MKIHVKETSRMEFCFTFGDPKFLNTREFEPALTGDAVMVENDDALQDVNGQPLKLVLLRKEPKDVLHEPTLNLRKTIFDTISIDGVYSGDFLSAMVDSIAFGSFESSFCFRPKDPDTDGICWPGRDVLTHVLSRKIFLSLKMESIGIKDLIEMNEISPGSIYDHPYLVDFIKKLSKMAVRDSNNDKRSLARDLLKRICVPGYEHSRATIPSLHKVHLYPLFRIYFDVVKIREVSVILQKGADKTHDNDIVMQEVRNLFPCLGLSDDDLGSICRFDEAKELGQLPPALVAYNLLGNAIGYEERSIRQKKVELLPEWPVERKRLMKIAKGVAAQMTS